MEEKTPFWFKNISDKVDEHTISSRDFRFFHIDRFVLSAKHLETFSNVHKCPDCFALRKNAEEIAENLQIYIDGNREKKQEFEQKFDPILAHLKQRHGLLPEQFYVSLYSFYGMLAGLAAGAAVGFVLGTMKYPLLVSWVVGLIAGRVLGSRKDAEQKKDGKIL